ncbi:MAG: response regulator [Bryobacteraceae bacterium]
MSTANPHPRAKTEREFAEAFRDPEEWLDLLRDASGICLAVADCSGRFVECNAAYEEMVGYSLEELRAMTLFDLTHPEDRAAEEELFRLQLAEEDHGPTSIRTKRYCRKDSQTAWVRIASRIVRFGKEPGLYAIAVATDVTAEKEAVDQFRKLSGAVEQSPVSVVLSNASAKVEYVNPRFTELTGFTIEDLAGKDPQFLHAADDPPETFRAIHETAGAGRVWRGEIRSRKKNGEAFWESATISPIKDTRGVITHFLAVKEDISRRKRMEEEIAWQSRINASMAEMSRNLVSLVSYEEISEAILKQALLHTGSRHGFVGYLDAQTGAFMVPTLSIDAYAACEIDPPRAVFKEFSGIWGWVLKNKAPLLTNNPAADPRSCGVPHGHVAIKRFLGVPCILGEEVLGMIAVANADVDYADREQGVLKRLAAIYTMAIERKRREDEHAHIQEQLRQSQKLEAIGQLAGGVAHDFNNLLTIINGYSDLALSRLDPKDPLCKELTEIRKAGERAASLTKQLLAFSRRQLLAPELIDLNTVVTGMEDMLRRVIGGRIDLVTVLEPDLGSVRADPGQIQQVIMNLAVNARDAMPNGGLLTVHTRNVELDEQYVIDHGAVKPGLYVMIAVSDTGIGMDEVTRNRIFEPFFTTKEQGKGTGLGLPTVYGIVKQSGGYVWVYSQPGLGTTMKVYLPRYEGSAEKSQARSAKVELPKGSETVLLVEDEDGVRALAGAVLRSCGYNVLEATSGDEGLQVSERYGGAIHVMITDLVMPGLTGSELASRITAIRPRMKVLLMSGYSGVQGTPNPSVPAGSAFLQKPFSRNALASKLRELLDGPAPRATVLVVDDEEEIRHLVRRILESAGFDVAEAGNGEEALAQLTRHGADLVITDLVMPDCEGIETISRLRKERPEMKIIAMSGAFGGRFLRVAQAVGAHAVIQKPLRADEVLEAVRRVLK